MSKDGGGDFETRLAAAMRGAVDFDMDDLKRSVERVPMSGGFEIRDPGDGVMAKRDAQKMMVAAMAVVMEEWHARGVVEGRLRERERIATILNHRASLGRRELATWIALDSDTSVDAAIAELEATPASKVI